MFANIAYLGPVGTFSEEAAERFADILGEECRLTPYTTITACADAAEDGVVQYAVVPLENSLEGSVHETLDILTTGLQLMIVAELVLVIDHALLVVPEHTGSISKVYSHPQALAQCRNYLRRHLPGAQLLPLLSTADAAAFVAREGTGIAAIGSISAANSMACGYWERKFRTVKTRLVL